MAVIAAVGAPVIFVAGGVADAVPSTLGPCNGDLTGTVFTLTANCATTAPIVVPSTVETIDGAGTFTISATDAGGAQWNGGILTNAAAGQTMNVQNLTITGPAAGFQLCTQAGNVLYGIWYQDASGTVTNVTVDHIFQVQNFAFGSCQTGRAIRADGTAPGRTVTITNTTVKDYQKSGFEARGTMTMTLSGSTAGPPHPLNGFIAQNAVSIVGAAATITNNTIIGSGDEGAGLGRGNGTGVLLFGAHDVTVDHNTITGVDTNIGVSVAASSTTNITISFNQIGRTSADAAPDDPGLGIDVDHPTSAATLICNTFSGWIANISGAVQMSCTALPNGTECTTYSANIFSVEGGTPPFTWSVASGSLPPGLTMAAADGSITGTNPTVGTFNFTVMVTDSTQPTLTATQDQTITITPCEAPTTTVPPTEPPTAAPTTPPSVAPTIPATLPPTGPGSSAPLYLGLVIVALGSVAVIVTTRRRARS